jgi:exosortase A-associated hydrolase 2
VTTEAFFLPLSGGSRFCVFHAPPARTIRGGFVYVHPFAEEMNKSRRMAALQSRALADAGHAVLQIDLLGCGDSSADFGDATWSGWVDDVVAACHWLVDRARVPLWLWGLRAGCLLAAEAAQRVDEPCNFLFWQPMHVGKVALQQFLRLKVASELLTGQGRSLMEDMRRQLARGESVEVSGYALSPELSRGLEAATLDPPRSRGGGRRLEWLELSARGDESLSPASSQAIERWRAAGVSVRSRVIEGVPFWQTVEVEDAPKLLAATLAAILPLAEVS